MTRSIAFTRIAASVLIAVTLGGCASLIGAKREPFTIYSPRYNAPASSEKGPRVDWQLSVETPLANDALSGVRMMVMPSPGVLEVFPSARWSDSAPAMLRGLIVRGFEQSQRIIGVGSTTSGLRADYSLTIDLHDFEIAYTGTSASAVVAFQARLLDYTSNRVLATRAFKADVPAQGSDAAGAFNAFQGALDEVIPKLVDWTFEAGQAAHARGKLER